MNTSSNARPAASAAQNMRGSAFMVLAMAGFGFNDIVVKHVSPMMEVGQVIFIRGLFATFFLAALLAIRGNFKLKEFFLPPALILRGIAEVLATLAFLIALFNIPIANTTAVLQFLPLMVALGGALFFGEVIGWRRLIAIGVGFIGVMIIIRPGMAGFSIYSLFVIGCVIFATIRDLSTRMIPKSISSMMVAFFTSVLVTIMGGVVGLSENWEMPQPVNIGWLALAAAFLIVGYSFIAASMREGDISVIVPFRYTILIYAIVGGVIFFDEIPDVPTLIGSGIIVATGIYTVYREAIRRKSPPG